MRTCLNPNDTICRKGCAGNAPCAYAESHSAWHCTFSGEGFAVNIRSYHAQIEWLRNELAQTRRQAEGRKNMLLNILAVVEDAQRAATEPPSAFSSEPQAFRAWNKPYGAPCPFCGCEKTDIARFGNSWAVVCAKCEADGPPGKTEPEAIERWNERYRALPCKGCNGKGYRDMGLEATGVECSECEGSGESHREDSGRKA